MEGDAQTNILSSSPSEGPGTRWSAGSAYSCHFSSAYRCGPEWRARAQACESRCCEEEEQEEEG